MNISDLAERRKQIEEALERSERERATFFNAYPRFLNESQEVSSGLSDSIQSTSRKEAARFNHQAYDQFEQNSSQIPEQIEGQPQHFDGLSSSSDLEYSQSQYHHQNKQKRRHSNQQPLSNSSGVEEFSFQNQAGLQESSLTNQRMSSILQQAERNFNSNNPFLSPQQEDENQARNALTRIEEEKQSQQNFFNSIRSNVRSDLFDSQTQSNMPRQYYQQQNFGVVGNSNQISDQSSSLIKASSLPLSKISDNNPAFSYQQALKEIRPPGWLLSYSINDSNKDDVSGGFIGNAGTNGGGITASHGAIGGASQESSGFSSLNLHKQHNFKSSLSNGIGSSNLGETNTIARQNLDFFRVNKQSMEVEIPIDFKPQYARMISPSKAEGESRIAQRDISSPYQKYFSDKIEVKEVMPQNRGSQYGDDFIKVEKGNPTNSKSPCRQEESMLQLTKQFEQQRNRYQSELEEHKLRKYSPVSRSALQSKGQPLYYTQQPQSGGHTHQMDHLNSVYNQYRKYRDFEESDDDSSDESSDQSVLANSMHDQIQAALLKQRRQNQQNYSVTSIIHVPTKIVEQEIIEPVDQEQLQNELASEKEQSHVQIEGEEEIEAQNDNQEEEEVEEKEESEPLDEHYEDQEQQFEPEGEQTVLEDTQQLQAEEEQESDTNYLWSLRLNELKESIAQLECDGELASDQMYEIILNLEVVLEVNTDTHNEILVILGDREESGQKAFNELTDQILSILDRVQVDDEILAEILVDFKYKLKEWILLREEAELLRKEEAERAAAEQEQVEDGEEEEEIEDVQDDLKPIKRSGLLRKHKTMGFDDLEYENKGSRQMSMPYVEGDEGNLIDREELMKQFLEERERQVNEKLEEERRIASEQAEAEALALEAQAQALAELENEAEQLDQMNRDEGEQEGDDDMSPEELIAMIEEAKGKQERQESDVPDEDEEEDDNQEINENERQVDQEVEELEVQPSEQDLELFARIAEIKKNAQLKRDIQQTLKDKSEVFDNFKYRLENLLRRHDGNELPASEQVDLSFVSEMKYEDNLKISDIQKKQARGEVDNGSERSAPEAQSSPMLAAIDKTMHEKLRHELFLDLDNFRRSDVFNALSWRKLKAFAHRAADEARTRAVAELVRGMRIMAKVKQIEELKSYERTLNAFNALKWHTEYSRVKSRGKRIALELNEQKAAEMKAKVFVALSKVCAQHRKWIEAVRENTQMMRLSNVLKQWRFYVINKTMSRQADLYYKSVLFKKFQDAVSLKKNSKDAKALSHYSDKLTSVFFGLFVSITKSESKKREWIWARARKSNRNLLMNAYRSWQVYANSKKQERNDYIPIQICIRDTISKPKMQPNQTLKEYKKAPITTMKTIKISIPDSSVFGQHQN